jgi:hypothetical protein
MSIYFTSFATEKLKRHMLLYATWTTPPLYLPLSVGSATLTLPLSDRSAALIMDNRTTPPPASVIQKIEADATKKTAEILTSAVPDTNKEKALVGAMNSGMEAFRAQMGRNPTYSEMRAMFG